MQLIGLRSAEPFPLPPHEWQPDDAFEPVYATGGRLQSLKRRDGECLVFRSLPATLTFYRPNGQSILYYLTLVFDDGSFNPIRWTDSDFFTCLGKADDPPRPGAHHFYRREYLIPLDHPAFARLVSPVRLARWQLNP